MLHCSCSGPYCFTVKLLVMTITCSEIVLNVLLCLVVDGQASIELDRHSDTEFLGLGLSSSSSVSRLSDDLLSLGSFSSIDLMFSVSSNKSLRSLAVSIISATTHFSDTSNICFILLFILTSTDRCLMT